MLTVAGTVQAASDSSVANLYPKAYDEALSKEARRSQDISQNGRKRIALVLIGNDDILLDKNTHKAIDMLLKEELRPYRYEIVRSKSLIGDYISFVEENDTRNPIDIPKGFSYKDHIGQLRTADYCRFASNLNYDYVFIFDMNRVLYGGANNGYNRKTGDAVSTADQTTATRYKYSGVYYRREEDVRIASKIIDVKHEQCIYRGENVRRGESYAGIIPLPILHLLTPGPSHYRAARRAILQEIGAVLHDIQPLLR